MSHWNLKDGVRVARLLHRALAPHYDVGICGGVLYSGVSSKDLDVIVYPTCSTRFDRSEIARLLTGAGFALTRPAVVVQAGWREYGSRDEKWVEEWSWRGRRVDVFMLQGEP